MEEIVACLEILFRNYSGQNKRVATVDVSVEMRTGHLQITGSDRQYWNQLAELFSYKRDNVGD